MGLFNIFSTKEIDDFAESLVSNIAKRYPPELENSGTTSLSEKAITNILEDNCKKAQNFVREKNLGVYKKARLGNTFRWKLTEAGYSDAFVEMATESIIVYVTKKPD
jgi:hypothetical protein